MKGGVPLKKELVKREIVYSLNRLPKREKPNPEIPDIIGRSFDGIHIEKVLAQSHACTSSLKDEGDAGNDQNNKTSAMPKQGIDSQKCIPALKDDENKSHLEMKKNRFYKTKSNVSIDCIKLDRYSLPNNPLLPISINSQPRLEYVDQNNSRRIQLKKESYFQHNDGKKRENNSENINLGSNNDNLLDDYGFSVTLKTIDSKNKLYAPPAKSHNIPLKQILKGVLSNSSAVQYHHHDNCLLGSFESNDQQFHPYLESKELSNKGGILTQKAVVNKTKNQFNSSCFISSREKKTFSLIDYCSNVKSQQSNDIAPPFIITKGHLNNHFRSKSDIHTKGVLNALQDTQLTEGSALPLQVKLHPLSLITPKLIPIKNSISQSSISNKVLFKGKAHINQQKQELHRINPNTSINHALIVSSVKQKTKKSMRDISVQSNDEDHDLLTSESFIGGESNTMLSVQNSKENQFSQNIQQGSSVSVFGNSGDFEKGFRLKIQRHLKISNSASSDSIRFLKSRNNIQSIGHKLDQKYNYYATSNGLKMGDPKQQQQQHLNRIELSSLPENGVATYHHRKSFQLNESDEDNNNDDDDDEKASYELETYVQEKRHID